MKAISVEQPFAYLISTGEKTIDVHSWKTDYTGDLLICSSKLPAYPDQEMEEMEEDWGCEFLYGYALCVVNLVEVRSMKEEDSEAACLDESDPDSYSWVLDNLRPVLPFPVKGQQGLFDVDDKLIHLPRFKAGDSVVVKEGILDPDFDVPIGGWQGRVRELLLGEEEKFLIGIEWDSVTLANMPATVIHESEKKDLEWTEMHLEEVEIEPAQPRDSEEDVLAMRNEIAEKYDLMFEEEAKEQSERVFAVLGIDESNEEDEDADVNDENLAKYLHYLKKNIKSPCLLTGREDFPWEEYYLFGPGSKKEYEKLKKSQPSYTDQFEFISFNEEIDVEDGIIVNVRRISDKKGFSLPLVDLETIDSDSGNYELLDDYSFWFVNYK